MIYKILQYGWMEIGLQDAIGTVHMTESADMQNLIITTGIVTCARTLFKKSAPVMRQVKDFFALLYRVCSR